MLVYQRVHIVLLNLLKSPIPIGEILGVYAQIPRFIPMKTLLF